METINWTKAKRYKRYETLSSEQLKRLKSSAKDDPYYPRFHIAPPHGLLNDPNGLCQFKGEHHIFYQWSPIGAVHGLKYWYHLSTRDYVTFTDHGIGLYPNHDHNSHGCYSGSALLDNEQVFLFYTGNKRDKNWVRESTQCLAVMDADGNIKDKGVLLSNSDYTEHFRDPKVWCEGDSYYMVVGAQNKALKGQAVLYRSDSPESPQSWQHLGMIKTQYQDFGYMWECPDLFYIDGKCLLLFSPQGVKSDDKYRFNNIFQTGYLLGEAFDADAPELINHQPFQELDSGFDFYAPQTYQDEQGRRILIGWIGLPDISYPTDKNHWAHLLSLPRQLSIKNNKLIQRPLPELSKLREQTMAIQGRVVLANKRFELECVTDADQFDLILSNNENDYIRLTMNRLEFELDRSKMTETFAETYGQQRWVKRTETQQAIRLFVDHSVLEVFLNNGKDVMTARFFVENLKYLNWVAAEPATLHYLSTTNLIPSIEKPHGSSDT